MLENGKKVKTSYMLGSTTGFLIHPKHLSARRSNTEGILHSYVPGHGGDVWFIQHDDDSVGAYSITEFCIL